MAALAALFAFANVTPSAAEVNELRIIRQYGVNYLQLMVMEDKKLIEKHARALGHPNLTVTWAQVASGSVVNDLLIGGNLHIASGGIGPLITLWAKTRGQLEVRGIASLNSMPVILSTRRPDVHTVKDFRDNDRIALPAIKVSIQAVTLQMAAAQAFGPDKYDALDHLTVSMSHPDGMIALLSGKSEVTAHFTGPPFSNRELKQPSVHKVVHSYELLGGRTTSTLVWATAKFRTENPLAYQAFYEALKEATDWINRDKRAAAELYVRLAGSKESVDSIYEVLNDPEIVFTLVPENVKKYADFMHQVGSIKVKPTSWTDIFFPEVHAGGGS
jgi:NitT/TauT family transport system substrate-binding protein